MSFIIYLLKVNILMLKSYHRSKSITFADQHGESLVEVKFFSLII